MNALARLGPHELLRHETVLLVDARIEPQRKIDEALHVAMAGEILADEARAFATPFGAPVCADRSSRCELQV